MGSVLDELIESGMKRCRWCHGNGGRGDVTCGPCRGLGAVRPNVRPPSGQQVLPLNTRKAAPRRSLEWEMARARRNLPPGWTVGIARAASGLLVAKALGDEGVSAVTFTAFSSADAIRIATDIDSGRLEMKAGPAIAPRPIRMRW